MQYGVHRRLSVVLLLLGAFIFMSAVVVSAADQSIEAMTKIEAMIEKIRTERPSPVQADVAEQLSAFLQHRDRSDIDALDAKTIDDIAGLLSDRDDTVRYWAALALGHIGAPAIRAAPALERALRDVEPASGSNMIGPDLSSASA